MPAGGDLTKAYELVVMVRDNNNAISNVMQYCHKIPFVTDIDVREPVHQYDFAFIKMCFRVKDISVIDKIKEELMLITGVMNTQVNKL